MELMARTERPSRMNSATRQLFLFFFASLRTIETLCFRYWNGCPDVFPRIGLRKEQQQQNNNDSYDIDSNYFHRSWTTTVYVHAQYATNQKLIIITKRKSSKTRVLFRSSSITLNNTIQSVILYIISFNANGSRLCIIRI